MFNPIAQIIRKLRDRVENTDGVALPDGTTLSERDRELASYYSEHADLPTPSLNALDSRSPSFHSVLAYLVDTGRTPASSTDLQTAYLAIHDRLPTDLEFETAQQMLMEFNLYASPAS